MNQKRNVIKDIYCRVKVKSSSPELMKCSGYKNEIKTDEINTTKKRRATTLKGGFQILFLLSTLTPGEMFSSYVGVG